MINLDQLRILQLDFLSRVDEYKEKEYELEKYRKEFVKLFPISNILNMTLENYVIGKESKESFCYLIERKLIKLGSILGGPSKKFGIYFSKKNSSYEFNQIFGENERQAFQNVKQAIYDLLTACQQGNKQKIKDNKISLMYKGKILATYFPDENLNIFSMEHLDYFLDRLGIDFNLDNDEIDKRELLLDFKKNDEVMNPWSPFLFMKFLYTEVGDPRRNNNLPEILYEYNDLNIDYPDLDKVKPEIIELKITKETEQISASKRVLKKIDFERENLRKRILGSKGEKIVEKYEKQHLFENGKIKLSNKVNRVSLVDDSLGYDVLSYNLDGSKKYIEVKSTTFSLGNQIMFNLSQNQYEIAKKLDDYYIYVVFNTRSIKPKIWKISNPFKEDRAEINLKPINYRVSINVEKS